MYVCSDNAVTLVPGYRTQLSTAGRICGFHVDGFKVMGVEQEPLMHQRPFKHGGYSRERPIQPFMSGAICAGLG